MKLTTNQTKAVKHVYGNALVNSSAGSGKTSVFTSRIANLIANEKVKPERILGLTFTKDAANNMKDRLGKIIGENSAEMVNLSTFHSFAYKFLLNEFPHEYKNIKITEMWWKIQTVYDIIGKRNHRNPTALGLDIKGGEMLAFISYQKSNMIRQGYNVIVDNNTPYVKHIPVDILQEAYDRYCEAVTLARTMDFDDMIMDTYFKLLENEDLLEEYRGKYDYIMVDEFQDTNSVNMSILELISDNNLFVVGDFRQGIYGFINANIDNILEFQDRFDNVELIELQDNFRSTENIVNICNDLVEASPVEKYKGFAASKSAVGEVGAPVKINVYNNEIVEIESIIDDIESQIDNDDSLTYNDFAILCRTNAQLGLFETVLADREIPARLSDERSFFDRKEISDILAYAEHAINPYDDMSLRRIANTPTRYLSRAVLKQLDEYAYNNNLSLEESIGLFDAGKSTSNLQSLKDVFLKLREYEKRSAFVFLEMILKLTQYRDYMTEKAMSPNEIALKEEAIERLLQMSKKFTTIKSFLANVQIVKNNSKKKDVAVNVYTAHASKGLEFEHVYVAFTTEGNYPHQMTTDPEEERRLLYVALSRAISTLNISTHVFTFSSAEGVETINPSPFLRDIMPGQLSKSFSDIQAGKDSSTFVYQGFSIVH